MYSLLLTAALLAQQEAKPFRYVTPGVGEAMEHPPFQPLALTSEKPEALDEAVTYRGKRQLYAQLRYGSPNSTRVVVVVDEIGPGEFDLYVDKNRNRRIEASELIAGTGNLRRLPLDAHIVQDDVVQRFTRSVILRRGVATATLGVATVGYMEGETTFNGKRLKARRVDGDANGLFADVRDRLWLDRDGDGAWDPISEQFPYTPVLRLDERRFAVRADMGGQKLAFEEIVGEGRLKAIVPALDKAARVQRLQVMLVGDDGAAFALQSGDAATLPIGRYALASVHLSIVDGKGPEPWNFVFSRSGGELPRRWYDVRADQETSVDIIGELRFELLAPDGAAKAGQSVAVSPRLYTGDGLLINSCVRGESDLYAARENYNCAVVRLLTPAAALLASQDSGFA